ncbi:hypothetical protein [Xanthomonas citri]|uniref:hypothetical protein n=1 Tax=Xanthomonas citri TaxID=346 RepID=UPI000CCE300F|nr:hypothetical protein [Xanthomonas citri]PNV26821.1 hypothetical protein xavtCFBP7764_21700 [Xanthomonas citri]
MGLPAEKVRAGGASPEQFRLNTIARLLSGVRYRYGSEVQLHEVMGQLLAGAGYAFEREYRLDARNRADFWLDGLVVEVKVDGSTGDALRQVGRYIELPQVCAVLLAATPIWASTPLPKRPAWGGKPFAMTRLQRQAL